MYPPEPRFTRRAFLRGTGALGAGLVIGLPTLLSACGGGNDDDTADTTAPSDGVSPTSAALAGGSVTMLNWVLYIEDDQNPSAGATIKGFTEKTGIKVDYQAGGIDGNDSFYTKYEPELSKGRNPGIDIVVLTSWMAARMIEKGFVETFDAANMANKTNVLPELANPTWDPGRNSTLPWATVLAGVAYYPDKVGFEIKSMNDLYDPRLKNRVTLLDEMRDTVGLTMLGMGLDPWTGALDDFKKAIEKIKSARDDGQIRKVSGNGYVEDLRLGDVWAAVGWAGDIASLQKDAPGLEWVFPAEGAMVAVDTAMILKGAPNKAGAEAFLNHVYDPAVAAPLYESINYPSPVKGALELMSPEAQKSPFIAPVGKRVEFKNLTTAEDEELATLFAEATQR